MGSLKRSLELVAVVLVLALFAVFAVQNGQSIVLKFWKYQAPELPLFLILLGFLLLGLCAALIICMTDIVRMRTKVFRLERLLRSAEKQVTLMKQQPLLEDYRSDASLDDEIEDDNPHAMDQEEDDADDDDHHQQ